jgi:Xaa-Pro aminopeptidase
VTERIERLRARLEEPLLVTSLVNVRYLTGLETTNAALLVEPERVRVFTDFRYARRARQLEGVETVEVGRNLMRSLGEELEGRVAFEAATVTYAAWETLRDAGLELVPTRGVVEGLRETKDEGELAAIRAATGVTNRAFERFAEERVTGTTERELAWRLERLLREEGADATAFPVVVAAGPTGASPHAVPGERVAEAGQTLVVDAGAKVDGYCSDCTRTFAVGGLQGQLADAYLICLEAQLAALDAVRPGAAGRDVDAVARRIIDGTPFKGMFGHGLGHGVGFEVHEAPTLRPESEDTLAAGNVTSVEPGIYVEETGGIRIEDLVIVHEGGAEVLTTFPKELTALR